MPVGEDIGYAAAALGVLGGGGLLTWARWLHRRGSSISGRWFAKHAAPIITSELRPVLEQMSTNGGSSVVDRLARVDQWTSDAEKRFDRIDKANAVQARRMDAHLQVHAK